MDNLLSIGQVAKLAGVSVQTLRHYDQLGLIKPSQVTDAGYRFYSDADCTRLELVRTLRGLGFDLDTIAGLVGGRLKAADAVGLQLKALEVQMRSLKRQQTVLRAVSKSHEAVALSRLQRMQALAGLDKLERESFLGSHLKKAMGGQTGNPEVWKAAVLDLPEELNEEQLELWLELAEIATSEGFQQTLRTQMKPMAGLSKAQSEAWGKAIQSLVSLGVKAVRAQQSPGDVASQAMLGKWFADLAKALSREPGRKLEEKVFNYFQSAYNPQMNRYWELVARLKGWEHTPIYGQASRWVLEGLGLRVKAKMRPK